MFAAAVAGDTGPTEKHPPPESSSPSVGCSCPGGGGADGVGVCAGGTFVGVGGTWVGVGVGRGVGVGCGVGVATASASMEIVQSPSAIMNRPWTPGSAPGAAPDLTPSCLDSVKVATSVPSGLTRSTAKLPEPSSVKLTRPACSSIGPATSSPEPLREIGARSPDFQSGWLISTSPRAGGFDPQRVAARERDRSESPR